MAFSNIPHLGYELEVRRPDPFEEPQTYWCPNCGKTVWEQPSKIHDPSQLICDECQTLYPWLKHI